MGKFKLSIGHEVSVEEALVAADKVELEVGEISNAKRSPGDISIHCICLLVQFVRDDAARRKGS